MVKILFIMLLMSILSYKEKLNKNTCNSLQCVPNEWTYKTQKGMQRLIKGSLRDLKETSEMKQYRIESIKIQGIHAQTGLREANKYWVYLVIKKVGQLFRSKLSFIKVWAKHLVGRGKPGISASTVPVKYESCSILQ